MRRLAVICLLLSLAGCARDYDQSALPAASFEMRIAMDRCTAAVNARKNYSEFAACQVAAERTFAEAIRLQKMDVFEAYAARMLALGAERDAKHLTAEETKTRVAAIRQNYLAACDCNRRMPRGGGGGGLGGDTGSFYQPADPGPAMIGGAVFNGR
jgi:hypothetical protein